MKVTIRQAREHNLKGVDVDFGDGLTVVTGVSGSGKTSLVFDTLYHESRRRFLEIFNLGAAGLRLAPAQAASITGLGPAVAVGQNLLNRNPASILATASGLHPFLRLLYANYGERRCPGCGGALRVYSSDALIEILQSLGRSQGSQAIYAPLVRQARGSHRKLLELLKDQTGPENLVIDGIPGFWGPLDPARAHDILVRIGLFSGEPSAQSLREVLQKATGLGVQAVVVGELRIDRSFHEQVFPMAPVCPVCGRWFGELRSTHFLAVCPSCKGSGVQAESIDCPECLGAGMHPDAASVRWNDLRLPELLALSVSDVGRLLKERGLPASASRLQAEIQRRLDALVEVGLGYLSLDRASPTLSRGEAQRVRLAVALTSRLEDMLHVLDEPTVGQHPADVARLLPVFRKLGGPVVYVEHDRLAAAFADRAIDLGPGAGQAGGEVIFSGTPQELWQADTPSGRWFSLRERQKDFPGKSDAKEFLVVGGASLRNLQGFDVSIPVGHLSVITGVSGSGKSTLVEDVLVASLKGDMPVGCSSLEGTRLKPVFVDQSPIGINPRSNPATYTGLADIIRDLFAMHTGLSPSHFSFNRDTGACPTCKGMGAIEVHMRYMPSTWIPCEDCEGGRFTDEVLAAEVQFNERRLNIAQFLNSSVAEAAPLLLMYSDRLSDGSLKSARNILQALLDVGLGYLPLGQPSPSLSGGEAQRVKLARSLGKRSLAGQLLILDEPSTGLHPQDVGGLLVVLQRLAHSGATLIVVEHNTDIIRAADWIIDLGPGAGPEGGRLLYAGKPDGLLNVSESQTAQALLEEDRLEVGFGDEGVLILVTSRSIITRKSLSKCAGLAPITCKMLRCAFRKQL